MRNTSNAMEVIDSTIKKLTINQEVKTIIQQVPEEYLKLWSFMVKFNLPYKGQGLPACTQEALLSLCQVKRKQFNEITRLKMMVKQGYSI